MIKKAELSSIVCEDFIVMACKTEIAEVLKMMKMSGCDGLLNQREISKAYHASKKESIANRGEILKAIERTTSEIQDDVKYYITDIPLPKSLQDRFEIRDGQFSVVQFHGTDETESNKRPIGIYISLYDKEKGNNLKGTISFDGDGTVYSIDELWLDKNDNIDKNLEEYQDIVMAAIYEAKIVLGKDKKSKEKTTPKKDSDTMISKNYELVMDYFKREPTDEERDGCYDFMGALSKKDAEKFLDEIGVKKNFSIYERFDHYDICNWEGRNVIGQAHMNKGDIISVKMGSGKIMVCVITDSKRSSGVTSASFKEVGYLDSAPSSFKRAYNKKVEEKASRLHLLS